MEWKHGSCCFLQKLCYIQMWSWIFDTPFFSEALAHQPNILQPGGSSSCGLTTHSGTLVVQETEWLDCYPCHQAMHKVKRKKKNNSLMKLLSMNMTSKSWLRLYAMHQGSEVVNETSSRPTSMKLFLILVKKKRHLASVILWQYIEARHLKLFDCFSESATKWLKPILKSVSFR